MSFTRRGFLQTLVAAATASKLVNIEPVVESLPTVITPVKPLHPGFFYGPVVAKHIYRSSNGLHWHHVATVAPEVNTFTDTGEDE
jgi:hypothetical protein